MSCGEENHPWCVYDGVNSISVAPETLMAQTNAAIAALEYARSAAFSQPPPPVLKTKTAIKRSTSQYDAQMADKAYKSGMASMAAGKVDEAVVSLNIALSKCPPDKTSAVAKLQSLISITSNQQQKPSN